MSERGRERGLLQGETTPALCHSLLVNMWLMLQVQRKGRHWAVASDTKALANKVFNRVCSRSAGVLLSYTLLRLPPALCRPKSLLSLSGILSEPNLVFREDAVRLVQ